MTYSEYLFYKHLLLCKLVSMNLPITIKLYIDDDSYAGTMRIHLVHERDRKIYRHTHLLHMPIKYFHSPCSYLKYLLEDVVNDFINYINACIKEGLIHYGS